MKLSFCIAILMLVIAIAVGVRIQLNNTREADQTASIVDEARARGLTANRERNLGEFAVVVHVTRMGEISLIPKSNVQLSVVIENCSLVGATIDQLFDGTNIRKLSFSDCSFSSDALTRISVRDIEDCSFEACSLSTEHVGEFRRLGHYLTTKRCEHAFTLAILPSVGRSTRVFVEPQPDVTIRLPRLEATEQLSVAGCAVQVDEAFAESHTLKVLNFKQVKIEGGGISICLRLPLLAFLGFDNCEVTNVSEITAGTQFSEKCLIYATGDELISRLSKVLPQSVDIEGRP